MRVTTSKSKNAESFYISKGYVNDKGVSTSVIVRKLGTLKELLPEHGPTRDDVMAWAKEEARLETFNHISEENKQMATDLKSVIVQIQETLQEFGMFIDSKLALVNAHSPISRNPSGRTASLIPVYPNT